MLIIQHYKQCSIVSNHWQKENNYSASYVRGNEPPHYPVPAHTYRFEYAVGLVVMWHYRGVGIWSDSLPGGNYADSFDRRK